MLFQLARQSRMKMALVVRTDLSMTKGKIASQVAHAAIQCFRVQDKSKLDTWLGQGQPKVVLKVDSLENLEKIQMAATDKGLCNQTIFDAGHTQIPSGTLTVLGIGPDTEENINQIVGHLKLM